MKIDLLTVVSWIFYISLALLCNFFNLALFDHFYGEKEDKKDEQD